VPRYGTIDHDYALRLASSDDGPIYMLNLMAYRDEADYGPDGEKGVTGREADDRYAPLDVLAEIGASVCFLAEVEAGAWDRVAVVRYPTRKSFIDMQSRPDFQAKHVHKEAGMERTIILGTVPTDGPQGDLPNLAPGDLVRLDLLDEPGQFMVEGAIVGDGPYKGVSYTPVGAVQGELVLRTVLSQW
jgi:hypothetical protein